MTDARAIGVAAGLGAAAAAGVGFYAGQYPTAQIFGPTICRNRDAGRRIALTYDDGPNPVHTPPLLSLLDRFGAKATFFSIGMWAEREPGLLREVHAAGHAVGNHTHTHPRMPMISMVAVKEELRRCRAAVEASGIEFSRANGGMLMRPPYGSRRPATLRALRQEGYEPVTWSITCYDWRRTATRRSIARHARRAGPGDIILMHDGSHLVPDGDRSRSIAATEDTLERYGAEGYEFVTVPELVGAAAPAAA
jgi:peptidoglycan/xylan/chitin deacetylase (PgdA/CDA1 family)